MWRTHHGLLEACRVAIRHESWSNIGSRETEDEKCESFLFSSSSV